MRSKEEIAKGLLQVKLHPSRVDRFILSPILWLTILASILCLFPSFLIRGLGGGSITPEHPGGTYLEISFWITAIGSAFLSFAMMELLFRSRMTKMLAPWPVPPLRIFATQMCRAAKGIAWAMPPWLALWFAPLCIDSPELPSNIGSIVAGCLVLMPAGLLVCAAISSAILVYTGNAATQKKAAFGMQAFGMAPAIALAVSLMTTLLLKLLVEAMLKPGFEKAAWTAFGITAGVFAIALLYAAVVFHRRYYAILANFMDTDRIVLNARYDFIGGKSAEAIRKATPQDAVRLSLVSQYRRRHPLAGFSIATCAVCMAIFFWNYAEFLHPVAIVLIVQIPWMLFGRPWAVWKKPEFSAYLDALPLALDVRRSAGMRASFSLLPAPAIMQALAAAIPLWHAVGPAYAAIAAVSAFTLCAVLTYIANWVRRP